MNNMHYQYGYNDGKNSASFQRPIHTNWPRDNAGNLVHFNPDYLAGYKAGWLEATGKAI